jgi:transmembrane protein EpsG
MWPYFLFLFICIVIGLFIELKHDSSIVSKLGVFLLFVTMVLFAGYRNETVGTDTGGYVFFFSQYDLSSSFDDYSLEIGYLAINYLAKYFYDSYEYLLLLVAAISYYFSIKSIYKFSFFPVISLFVFISFGMFLFGFNGIRQSIAAYIIMFSLPYMFQKRLFVFSLLILLAFQFHKSSVVFFPFYFMLSQTFSVKYLLKLILVTISLISLYTFTFSYVVALNQKYAMYYESKASGGEMLTFGYVSLAIFFILFRKRVKSYYLNYYDFCLNMFLIGTAVFIFVQLSGVYVEVTRLAIYFLMAAIFLWPIVFKSLKKTELPLVYIGFFIFHISFYAFFILKIGGLYPYTLS